MSLVEMKEVLARANVEYKSKNFAKAIESYNSIITNLLNGCDLPMSFF